MANSKDTAPKNYSFEIAKSVLSDTEKNRCLCLFLNMDHSSINWARATTDFECKSIESMRVMTRATLKKITDAEKNGAIVPSGSSKAKGAAAGGKKRKASAAAAAAADDGDDEETLAPTKKVKGAGKKKKKADTPVEDDEETAKKEDGDDEELEF